MSFKICNYLILKCPLLYSGRVVTAVNVKKADDVYYHTMYWQPGRDRVNDVYCIIWII